MAKQPNRKELIMKIFTILFRILFSAAVLCLTGYIAYLQFVQGFVFRGIVCIVLGLLFLCGCYLQSKVKEGMTEGEKVLTERNKKQ